jgi:hypothetical protein
MGEIEKATNGDRIQPVVDRTKVLARAGLAYAREHPDEVAVAAAPIVLTMLATRRHKLNAVEAALIAEVGYWCGVLLAREYKAWKSRPAAPLPNLRRVI